MHIQIELNSFFCVHLSTTTCACHVQRKDNVSSGQSVSVTVQVAVRATGKVIKGGSHKSIKLESVLCVSLSIS